MRVINNCNLYVFILGIGILSSGPTFGGALKSLAEANNKSYREVRALGLNPDQKQVVEIQNRNFAPALQQLQKERAEKFKNAEKVAISSWGMLKHKAAEFFGLTGKSADADPNSPAEQGPQQAGTTPAPSKNRGQAKGNGFHGTDSAKDVDFGTSPGGQDKKGPIGDPPTVEDGIIQER